VQHVDRRASAGPTHESPCGVAKAEHESRTEGDGDAEPARHLGMPAAKVLGKWKVLRPSIESREPGDDRHAGRCPGRLTRGDSPREATLTDDCPYPRLFL